MKVVVLGCNSKQHLQTINSAEYSSGASKSVYMQVFHIACIYTMSLACIPLHTCIYVAISPLPACSRLFACNICCAAKLAARALPSHEMLIRTVKLVQILLEEKLQLGRLPLLRRATAGLGGGALCCH